jgi:ATP-dependent Zn protease
LLYGPTGTGKTQFVKAIAGESELPILILNTGKIIDKYIGESEKNIEFIFQLAKKHAPCIIFIDEIDELLQKRNSENKKESNFVNEFLQQIDGFSELKGVCLIGATNRLDQIDESILRPGRIDKKILIDYPSLEDRKEIIEYYIETNDMKLEDSLQLENFSDQLDGFTGADIKGLFSYIKDIFEEKNNPEEKNNIISEKIVNDAYKIFKEENKKEDFKFITIKDKKLNTIAGYKFVKEELNNILEELKGQYTKKTKLEGVILHGPPGTGKTQFARVLACESELPLVIISPADLLGVYIGDSERKLTLLFENIRKNSPCIVFIDEMEALFKNRNNNNNYTDSSKLYNNIINTFLQNIDGINALKGVLFIGATNYIELIDPALTRSGRMSNHIKINYPQYKDRIEIVRYYITENNINLKPSISLEYLAERTNGMSPADIEKYLKLIKKIGKDENKNIIDNVIIAEATQQMLLGKKDSDIIMSKETIEQTAYHEACHALLQYILYKEEKSLYKFDFFTIEPRQNTLGVAYGISPAEYLQPTKERYLGSIAIKLAGKAGQEIFFNTTDAGASNDLEGATYLATIMITKYGMGSQLKVFFNETEKNKEINDEIEIILKNEYKKVLQFIENNKELIKNIVKKVFEKNILYENDMETIIKEYEKRIGKKIVYL